MLNFLLFKRRNLQQKEVRASRLWAVSSRRGEFISAGSQDGRGKITLSWLLMQGRCASERGGHAAVPIGCISAVCGGGFGTAGASLEATSLFSRSLGVRAVGNTESITGSPLVRTVTWVRLPEDLSWLWWESVVLAAGARRSSLYVVSESWMPKAGDERWNEGHPVAGCFNTTTRSLDSGLQRVNISARIFASRQRRYRGQY